MGWFQVKGKPNDIIGDGPLDALGEAAGVVVSEYMDAFGRMPTKSEWEALLSSILGAEEPEQKFIAGDGTVRGVIIEIE